MSVNRANTEVNATFTQTSIGPSSRLDPLGGRVDLLVVRDVGRRSARARPPAARDLLGGARRARVSPRASSATRRPAGRERPRAGAPDAAAGTGHDDDL